MNYNLKETYCAICESKSSYSIEYKRNSPEKLDDIDYSGRKNPDNYHYQMVRCKMCGLLYANEIFDIDFINKLYEDSKFEYINEIKGIKKSYSNCIKYVDKFQSIKDNFLDIGCGNGFLLQDAKQNGYQNVHGSEISKIAISMADANIKDNIIPGPFDPSNYNENSFDLICFAQILEHVDPNKFLKDIYKILKPGGFVLGITHNEKHFLAKILKNKHPIINDEHICIFNKSTLKKIFNKHNYKIITIKDLRNFYTLSYWIKMFPLFPRFKNAMHFITKIFFINKLNIGLKAGNIFIISQKK